MEPHAAVRIDRAHAHLTVVVQRQYRRADLVGTHLAHHDGDFSRCAAQQPVVGVGNGRLHAVRAGCRIRLVADETDRAGCVLAGRKDADRGSPYGEAADVSFGDLTDQQHRIQVDDPRTRCRRLRVVTYLKQGLFDHPAERGSDEDPLQVQGGGFELRFGGGQPRLRLGDRGL